MINGTFGTQWQSLILVRRTLIASGPQKALTIEVTENKDKRTGALLINVLRHLDGLLTTQGLDMDGKVSPQQRLRGWDRE